MVTVRLSFSPLSIAPIIDTAINVRPSAAVAVRERPCSLRARSTICVPSIKKARACPPISDIVYIPSICKTSIYGLLARKCMRSSLSAGAAKV